LTITRLVFVIASLAISNLLLGQSKVDTCKVKNQFLKQEIKFIEHLIENEEFENVVEVSSDLDLSAFCKIELIDSLNFYSGWADYRLKNLENASYKLNAVTQNSSLFLKSKFYAAYCETYNDSHDLAESTLNKIYFNPNLNNARELLQFQYAGNYLLKREYDKFDSILVQLDSSNFLISKGLLNLRTHKNDLIKVKSKSPALAGVLSAVIPGSGKFYAGFKGQALGAALPCFLFGAVAAEQYIKSGPDSFQFITFASIFGLFYIGNIWGSVISVRTYKDDSYKKIDNSILVDLHIPIRRFFD